MEIRDGLSEPLAHARSHPSSLALTEQRPPARMRSRPLHMLPLARSAPFCGQSNHREHAKYAEVEALRRRSVFSRVVCVFRGSNQGWVDHEKHEPHEIPQLRRSRLARSTGSGFRAESRDWRSPLRGPEDSTAESWRCGLGLILFRVFRVLRGGMPTAWARVRRSEPLAHARGHWQEKAEGLKTERLKMEGEHSICR
jgi:hypothetical protein